MTAIEKHYTLAEVRDILKVSKVTLWKYMKDGKLKVVVFSQKKKLIKESDLKKFIDQHRTK
jgi:predicted site-specific integrase-resolvase